MKFIIFTTSNRLDISIMKESHKTFTFELAAAIISLILAIVIFFQYTNYQQRQREETKKTALENKQ